MKIAFVVHDFLLGIGHGRYCIELARRFAGDHEIHVLANRGEAGLDFAFTQHVVPAWRATALASVLTFPAAAQRILDREKFDVVHAQGYCCRHADVITAHVCNAARYKQSPARSLRKRLFPWLVIPQERSFFRANARAKTIAIAKVIQRELSEEYGTASEVIYHGVDTETFSPRAGARAGGPWRWLFVGEAVKGLTEALTALARFPTARLEVVSRSRLNAWREMARALKIADRVDFRGAIATMAEVYRAADVFIYPSNYDAFGMVVAEAMACGLPVIVDQGIGAAEWIESGVNGFVFEAKGRMPSLIEHLERLQRNGATEIAQAARATAVAHSWDDCAQRTLAVYQRAMASKRQQQ